MMKVILRLFFIFIIPELILFFILEIVLKVCIMIIVWITTGKIAYLFKDINTINFTKGFFNFLTKT